jgi:hypothetical protein
MSVSLKQRAVLAALAALLLTAVGLWIRTAPPTAKAVRKQAATLAAAELVDQSTYTIAERLFPLAGTPEEQPLAASALRVADHALDLAFTTALSEVEAHPPALNSEAAKIQDRIKRSQTLLDNDQQRVTTLNNALPQAKAAQKDALQDELDLAQSQLELDKDELDEANQDLAQAGGNPRRQIESMIQEHSAETKALASRSAPTPAPSKFENGSLGQFREWLGVRRKRQALQDAETAAALKAAELQKRRSDLAGSLESAKRGISGTAPAAHSHDDAAALLTQTRLIAADQKILTMLDRRVADQRQLNRIYGQWAGMVDLQAQVLAHTLLLNALIVILLLMALVLLEKWLTPLFDNPKLDRRQAETLRSITRVALRVLAVVIILLIAIGMPSQFGTMIGIVGAGLTVALKDFIVAFFGWLVLMGRNGIRLGDWVEINGVSGEVTELGMFHTVLLETGNWSDSGHPTGRRVTFTNSFAIEGHYFNFSTANQWLWDELQVTLPPVGDPYGTAEQIRQTVETATATEAVEAAQDWQRVTRQYGTREFSAKPAVDLRPSVNGLEVFVRYITRAPQRYVVKSRLFQQIVPLLRGGATTAAAPTPSAQ